MSRSHTILQCGAAVALGSVWLASACGHGGGTAATPATSPGEDTDGGPDGEAVRGGPCVAAAGALPAPNCDDSTNECAEDPGCVIDEAKCGSASTCLPMADNKGKSVLDFRLRRLHVVGPKALASAFLQQTVVTSNIDLAATECGELGKGLFSWLMRIDRTKSELTTGGAPVSGDPFGKGYCFGNFTAPGGIPISPITVKLGFTGDTFRTEEKKKLNVPIFLAPDIPSVIVLPINDVTIEGATISAGGDCIGSLNATALAADCKDDPSTCTKWNTAGALGGYITLEDADGVFIAALNESLCVVLTQSSKDPATNKCRRDNGKIAFSGDYCSTDKQPGSCQDSLWMAATFAAAAVEIFDGATVPACNGTTRDSGVDAALDGSADAGPDARDATSE